LSRSWSGAHRRRRPPWAPRWVGLRGDSPRRAPRLRLCRFWLRGTAGAGQPRVLLDRRAPRRTVRGFGGRGGASVGGDDGGGGGGASCCVGGGCPCLRRGRGRCRRRARWCSFWRASARPRLGRPVRSGGGDAWLPPRRWAAWRLVLQPPTRCVRRRVARDVDVVDTGGGGGGGRAATVACGGGASPCWVGSV